MTDNFLTHQCMTWHNLWHYDCLIWYGDHRERQTYRVVWSWHEGVKVPTASGHQWFSRHLIQLISLLSSSSLAGSDVLWIGGGGGGVIHRLPCWETLAWINFKATSHSISILKYTQKWGQSIEGITPVTLPLAVSLFVRFLSLRSPPLLLHSLPVFPPSQFNSVH